MLRDYVRKHMAQFQPTIRNNRATSQAVVAAYVDGLAGAVALTIAGRQGFRTEVIEATIKLLRDCIDRDLKVL